LCRIVGFLDFNYRGGYNLEKTITNMRDTMVHGGPDDAGIYVEIDKGLALGHRRLSIIDLSELGRQPMEFDNLVITYNGEIYNFQEIKEEVKNEGYNFRSQTDTEVILKLFDKYGYNSIDKFRGMFAFAIWDRKKEELILCRDRVGVKPLYWYYKDGLFMFSSELKAFHKHPNFHKELDENALMLFLKYGYINAPFSIFKNTYKVEPGCFVKVDKSGKINKYKYWDIQDFMINNSKTKAQINEMNENEIIEKMENILIDSFKLRLVSDVPVGVFLSGGIDSSLITALLQKELSTPLKTFTIGFKEKEYNEANWANQIANYLKTEHTQVYCSPDEAQNIIQRLPEIFDEPFGDSSAIPTLLVSQLARSSVKVALSGEGGDEQFCGYHRYRTINRIMQFTDISVLQPYKYILRLFKPELAFSIYNKLNFLLPKWDNFKDRYIKFLNVLKEKEKVSIYDISNSFYLLDDLKKLGLDINKLNTTRLDLIIQKFGANLNGFSNLSLMMLIDLISYLPDDILVKLDRASMSVSLEGREPLLDNKILEFSSLLPLKFKLQHGSSKYILKKILYKYIPKNLLDRPKQGFSVPINYWFKKELKDLYCEYLNKDRIARDGIFDAKQVEKLLNQYLNDEGINYHKIWFLFTFQQWKEKWLN